jgi:hypothetical protein
MFKKRGKRGVWWGEKGGKHQFEVLGVPQVDVFFFFSSAKRD